MKNFIPLVLIGGGLFYLLRRTQSAVNKIEFDVYSIKVDMNKTLQSGFQRIYLTVKIKVLNPGGVKTTINQLTTELTTALEPLGTFAIQNPVIITEPEEIITLNGTVKTLNGFNIILNAIQTGNLPKITAQTELTTNFGTFNKTNVIQL
jgi:hypothetical protein